MIDLGTVKPGSTIRIPFSTFDKDDSSSITMTNYAAADILVYKDGGTTERASTSGFTATTDFDSKTGKHLAIIDLADNTTSGFFNAGSEYLVAIDAVTVDSVTTGGWIGRFRIGYPSAMLDTTIASLSSQTSFTLTAGPAEDDALNGQWAIIHDVASAVQCARVLILDYTGSTKTVTLAAGATFTVAAGDNISIMGMAPLQPTTLGRTLDVSSGGEAGIDWANVGSPTTTVNLSGTTVKTATDVETDTQDIQSRIPAALGANGNMKSDVRDFNGNAGTFSSGRPEVNTSHWGGTAIASANVRANLVQIGGDTQSGTDAKDFFDTGYDPATHKVQGVVLTDTATTVTNGVNATKLGGTSIGAGSATNWHAFWNDDGQTSGIELGGIAKGIDLLRYFQIALRKDSAIATDAAAWLTTLNGDAGSGAGGYANTSDAQEAIRDNMGTAQTGDAYARIGSNGAGLSAIPWNASWDAEVQSECADAITAASLPTAAGVADAVWEEAIADHSGTTGSTAEQLAAAGASGDPWATALPGSYTSGQAGAILGGVLNVNAVQLGGTEIDAESISNWHTFWNNDASVTGTYLDKLATAVALKRYFQVALRKDSAIATDASQYLSDINENAGSGAGGYANATDSQEAMRDNMGTAQSGDTYTRLGAPAGASTAADIAAVKSVADATKAKTDNLPASPAAVGSAMTLANGSIVTATFGACDLTSTMKASVNAEVLDVLGTDTPIDGKTIIAALKIIAAVVAGKVTGAGTTTNTFLGLDGSTTRVTSTVDSSGNRSAEVYS